MVSVVIPVFNTAPYLSECLYSVLAQHESGIEVICVDDGSTDKSPEILSEWAAKDHRLTVIRQENSGQGAARNRGIAAAKGKFILFVDSDDILLPGAISLLLKEVKDAQVIAYNHLTFIDKLSVENLAFASSQEVSRDLLLRQMGVVWNKMINREWWINQNIRFKENVIFEDIPVHWQLVLAPESILYLPANLYALRVRADSTTSANTTTRRRLESVLAHDEVERLFYKNPSWIPYAHIRIEIMLRNLANCIDALRHTDRATQSELRQIVDTRLTGIDLSNPFLLGLSNRELDTIRAFQGHLPSLVRRRIFLTLRLVVRMLTGFFR